MTRIAPVLAFAILSAEAAVAENPSFDCSKASTPVEETICEDTKGLAMRDGVRARLYAALKEQGSHASLLKGQVAWLKSRDACGTDAACLEKRIDFDEARAMGDAWLWIGLEAFPGQGECHILFRPGRQSVRVDSFDCRYYCGTNGWFDETYKRPQ